MAAATERQDRRSYYKPRKRRNKALLSTVQLLQCLVYLESEPYEKQRERAGDVGEDHLIVWSIKCLIQTTMVRNAFHVALGVCRFLYRYSTKETMALFDLVAQDPECHFEEDYCRARKKILLRELLDRFESRVELCRGPHREEMLRTRKPSVRQIRLVRECLERFTPWETGCVVPEGLAPLDDEIPGLRSTGDDSDQAHRSEVHRIHAMVHPACFVRLTSALRLDPPEERLVVVRFRGTNRWASRV